jgi:hypothetical protein
MSILNTIDEHIVIRETIGYEGIKDIDILGIPSVLKFLKIVHNYQKIKKIAESKNT